MALSRDQIRERIDALECLQDVQSAISDVEAVEWEEGEAQLLDIQITTREDNKAVTFVHGLPPSVLIAGLRAMEAALYVMADVRETVDLP